jgi:TDG/mug DNA glycosylase family protein
MKPDIVKCSGFPAISRTDARVLILGTLPGNASLDRREYYAQPRNVFWRIMENLLGVMADLPYEQRILRLTENGIALWDVCAAAHRSGSLDSAIGLSTLTPNDFRAFFSLHSGIGLVCFNGRKAAEIYSRRVLPFLPAIVREVRREILPSTSPAHAAMPFHQKLSRWQAILR